MAGLLLLLHKTINWLNVQNVWKCADDPRIVVDRFHLIILFLNISTILRIQTPRCASDGFFDDPLSANHCFLLRWELYSDRERSKKFGSM